MPVEIIYYINKISCNNKDELACNENKLSIKELIESKKMRIYKFINYISGDSDIYYYSTINHYEPIIFGNIFIPIIDIMKEGVLLDYEYYKNIYKKNNAICMINKRRIISYYNIGLHDPYKTNEDKKDI